MYLGASPYFWGNLCDNIGFAMGWETAFSNKPASIFGYVEMQTTATVDMVATIKQTIENLYQGLRSAKQYSLQTAEFFATIASQQGSGAAGSTLVAAENLFNRAEADIQARYLDAIHEAEHLYNLAVQNSQSLYFRSLGYTDQKTLAAIQQAQHLYNLSVWNSQSLFSQSMTHADQLFALAGANLSGAVRSLTSDMAGLRNVLESEIGNALLTAEGFATSAATSAAAGAAAKLATQLQPQLDQLKTETDTCLAPLCDEVTPNAKSLGKLGRNLTGFASLGVAGLLVGLVAEAIADPAAAADQITGALGWTDSVAVELVNAVVG